MRHLVSPPSLRLRYWAGLRISEIAALRLNQCAINQRAGSITLVDGKGGKTRTLDLHNMARRALYDYLSPAEPYDDDRDPESVYVFTGQRAAWLRQSERPDHLSERGIEHLWAQFKRQGSYEEWQLKDWQELRTTGTPPVAVPLDASTYLAERKALLHEQLTRVGQLLKENALPDVRIDKNKVRITPLDAEIPEGVEELARRANAKVRRIKITQLLIEIDQLIHFSRHFTHLHSGEPAKDREALFASLLAEATNLGLTKMADATPGMKRTRLSWVSDWYVRDDCFTKALAEIVNYHHRLPFSANRGDGTTSSSDGQRFPVGGPRSNTAQINAKYGPSPASCSTPTSPIN